MTKKTGLLIFLAIILMVMGFLAFKVLTPQKIASPLSALPVIKPVSPSNTFLDYQDPSGFSFSYPDNLSLAKNDITDNSTYADLQLSSKDVSGSINIKIYDSPAATIDQWVKSNTKASKSAPKDTKLGNLNAKEIITSDRLLLGAIDSGVFFSVEMPAIEQNFWTPVYQKILSNFSFTAPPAADSGGVDDVSFEGEETVQ